MTNVWNRNGIRCSFFPEITDHVLDQDGALSNFAIDRNVSSIGALKSKPASRHLDRILDDCEIFRW